MATAISDTEAMSCISKSDIPSAMEHSYSSDNVSDTDELLSDYRCRNQKDTAMEIMSQSASIAVLLFRKLVGLNLESIF